MLIPPLQAPSITVSDGVTYSISRPLITSTIL